MRRLVYSLPMKAIFKAKETELIFEKVWSIIQTQKMKNINRETLKEELLTAISEPEFNIYGFAEKYRRIN